MKDFWRGFKFAFQGLRFWEIDKECLGWVCGIMAIVLAATWILLTVFCWFLGK